MDRPWLPLPGSIVGLPLVTLLRFPDLGEMLPEYWLVVLERAGRKADAVAGWGRKVLARWARHVAARLARPFFTLEDGFLRSVGLGFPGTVPISLCFDASGIYYDATTASDLETLLETGTFPVELTERAARLRQAILQAGLTKYNLRSDVPDEVHRQARGRRRVLVAGQVPDDQSLRLGLPSHASNLEFLRAVRRECPDAFIIFKEHPDLVAGKRPGLSDPTAAGALADYLAVSGDAAAWIDFADEVHVRTSLAGFEALLRNKPVICHGAPFFAGWGLTTDRVAISRRTRRRTLDELVAAALILYPSYLHPVRGLPMEAEDAVSWLSAARQAPAGRTNPLRRIIRWWPRNAVSF